MVNSALTRPIHPRHRDHYQAALGLTFDWEDKIGVRFFRSSLVQTAFYALFTAWVLWDRSDSDEYFSIEDVGQHLRIPFLATCFKFAPHLKESSIS